MANFTSIATGAAANASTVNTPLGQLDTAIGVLGSLTTTDKTNLVAAVNEAKVTAAATSGALASLATTDKTSLVAALNEIRAVGLGGANATTAQLVAWAEAEAYQPTSVTMNPTFPLVVSTAVVKWPDGSDGTFTTVTINTLWETVDAYTVTHVATGTTVTQALVTRDGNGLVIAKPLLTVT